MDECEHDWRIGPRIFMTDSLPAVCCKCWAPTMLSTDQAATWPMWTEEDYWNNLDAIEGDRAPDLRRMREAGEL
jgi:hypothetical protein